MKNYLILIKGAGEMASGVAHRLVTCGFKVVMTEQKMPVTVRRTVAFSQAVFEKNTMVEGITARLACPEDIESLTEKGDIPVLIDPEAQIRNRLAFDILVDAVMAKKNTGTHINDAPLVVALGPGFVAEKDAHYVIETMRGHNLGRVIDKGSACPPTGIPGEIAGKSIERVLRAPCDGCFVSNASIGDKVPSGSVVAYIEKTPVVSQIDGVVRGLLFDGISCYKGQKIGDVDPRGEKEYCFTISEKARAIGGGVLEAILRKFHLLK